MDTELQFPPHYLTGACQACPKGFTPLACQTPGCAGRRHVLRTFMDNAGVQLYLLQCSSCMRHTDYPV